MLFNATSQGFPGALIYVDVHDAFVSFGGATNAWDPTTKTLGTAITNAPDTYAWDGKGLLGPATMTTTDGGVAISVVEVSATNVGHDDRVEPGVVAERERVLAGRRRLAAPLAPSRQKCQARDECHFQASLTISSSDARFASHPSTRRARSTEATSTGASPARRGPITTGTSRPRDPLRRRR